MDYCWDVEVDRFITKKWKRYFRKEGNLLKLKAKITHLCLSLVIDDNLKLVMRKKKKRAPEKNVPQRVPEMRFT